VYGCEFGLRWGRLVPQEKTHLSNKTLKRWKRFILLAGMSSSGDGEGLQTLRPQAW